ncbi:Major facilitator superfamily like protein [Aduncisulcus paluster]|uniref:Major facilitator superfamily like protein n=1 Tax=Aduncisulcus paluster TaxID=2918883 RepID=A0ABQ5KHE5_9EUKA|nr:Major facilitator superfamily like protein [Aduncisulcus paluster]
MSSEVPPPVQRPADIPDEREAYREQLQVEMAKAFRARNAKLKDKTFTPGQLMLLLCWSTVLCVIDMSIQAVSLDAMCTTYDIDKETSNWVSTAYQIPLAAISTIAGKIGDRYNITVVHRIAMISFVVLSVMCGISSHWSFMFLVIFRALQGAAAAFLLSANLNLIPTLTVDGRFKESMGYNTVVVAISSPLGPVLGGFIMQWASWPWIYYINIIPGVIGVILCWKYLPNIPSIKESKFDIAGALFILVSLAVVVYGLTQLDSNIVVAIICLISGIIALGLTLVYEWYLPDTPVLPRRLMKNLGVMCSLGGAFVCFAAQASTVYSMPYLLETCWHVSYDKVGLLSIVGPIFNMVGALFSTHIKTVKSRTIRMLSQFGMFIGYCTIAAFCSPVFGYDEVGPSLIFQQLAVSIGSFTQGCFTTMNTHFALQNSPLAFRGVSSGLVQAFREAGFAFGTALANAIIDLYVESSFGPKDTWPDSETFDGAFRTDYVKGCQLSFLLMSLLPFLGALLSWLSGVHPSEDHFYGMGDVFSCKPCRHQGELKKPGEDKPLVGGDDDESDSTTTEQEEGDIENQILE